MATAKSSPQLSNQLCECGCGRQTNIITRTYTGRGYKKGDPQRFVEGHKLTTSYRKIGWNKYLHRARAEKALGKPLPEGAVVHHIDGSMRADAPLVICEDQAYHMLLHARMRVKAAGGNPNTDKICSRCQLVKPALAFYANRRDYLGRHPYCRDCYIKWRDHR